MSRERSDVAPATRPVDAESDLAGRIAEMVRGVRFGSVEIVIHEGRVVQIERREKLRVEL